MVNVRESADGEMVTMTNVLTYLEALVRETQKPEAEVLTLAFQAGLRQLWRERILGRYLLGEISRDEAVEAVGIDWVDLAERQHKAMMEDLAWALGN
jgi:hypothetical protein